MFKKISLINIKAQFIIFSSDLNPDNFMELINLSKLYRDISLSTLQKDVEKLEKYGSLDPIDIATMLDQKGEEADNIRSIASIGEELAIIGLYKTIEITIKKCTKFSELFSKEEINEMYNFKTMKKLFKDREIFLTKIENYKEFNELRALNNCLKHSGKVSKELHKINPSFWKVNAQIENSVSHFNRLINPSLKFLKELGIKISNKMKELEKATLIT